MRPHGLSFLTAQNKANSNFPFSSPGQRSTSCVLIMAFAEAIAVYCFAFLTSIFHIGYAVVQWRNTQEKSQKYLCIQVSLVVAFFFTELALVVLSRVSRKETREVMLHSLQGLSLLQGLIIEVSSMHGNVQEC